MRKALSFLSILLLPILLLGQLPCMDCDPAIPMSYNTTTFVAGAPGEDIVAPTVAVCPWGIQLAVYSTFQMGPENSFCVYQEGRYHYFLVWELFSNSYKAKRKIKQLGLEGKAIPKMVQGFSIFVKP